MEKRKKSSLVTALIFIIPVLFIATASMAVTVTVQNSAGSSVSTTYYTEGGDHASGDANLVNGTVNVTTSGSVERGLIRTQGGDGSRDFCPFTGAFEAGGTASGDSAGTTSSCTGTPRVNIFIVSQNPDRAQNCCASVYDNIQDAVKDAPDAGKSWVLVDDGTYKGAVIDTKNNLSLESVWGAADTTIDGREGGATTLYAHDSPNLSIDGFTITGGDYFGSEPGDGLYVNNCDNATIKNNTVKNNVNNGIYVGSSKNAAIANNTATNNGWDGIGMYSSDSAAIENNTGTDNLFSGIYVGESNDAKIKYNTVADNECGIYVGSSNSAIIENNTVTDNQAGIYLSHSTGVSVNRNNIYGNRYYGLRNNQLNAVDAENNWWGHAPPDYEGNLGVNVMGPEGTDIWDAGDNLVDYNPWATAPY
jgi:parallel beta-helix repeat protein